jgi:hypothetical protein
MKFLVIILRFIPPHYILLKFNRFLGLLELNLYLQLFIILIIIIIIIIMVLFKEEGFS